MHGAITWECRKEVGQTRNCAHLLDEDDLAADQELKAWRILRAGVSSANRSTTQKFLAIFRRASSTHMTEDLRKMLLSLEAAGHSDVQNTGFRRAQHLLSPLYPVAPDKLVWGFARRFAKHPRKVSCAQVYRLRQLNERQFVFHLRDNQLFDPSQARRPQSASMRPHRTRPYRITID